MNGHADQDDIERRNALVMEHLDLAGWHGRRYLSLARLHACGLSHEDMIQAAFIGLIKAAETFDESKGIPFAAWATGRIRGEMQQEYQRNRSVVRIPRRKKARELGIKQSNLGNIDVVDPSTPPNADMDLESDLKTLESKLDDLPPTLREVVSLKYGFGRDRPMSLREIGPIFDRSHQWVQNMLLDAYRRLRSEDDY